MLVAFCLAPPVEAREEGELRIACASNFYPTLKKLAVLFNEDHPQVALDLISGASGHLYQQIRHGAPYQLFLSADSAYPAALHRGTTAVACRAPTRWGGWRSGTHVVWV